MPPGTPAISLKRAAKLNTKKHREAERLFLAEGITPIGEAPAPPVQVFEEADEVRHVSALKTPTGPVGVFPFLDVPAAGLLATAERIVLLHGVQDPGNVGTVIRSAHAFGAGVALSKGCADLYNPKTVRATMGSIFRAPVARELDSLRFIGEAARVRFRSVAAVPEGGDAPRSLPPGRLLICVGTEGSGLSEEVLEACESRVTVPSRAASLNAGVAASILLYEAYSRVLP
ncbi:MAG: RNA methyltransferase [Actinomycetota bacterium]|nr:RNA methyltransferase [Actinomycetota bacterium]